LSTAQTEAAQAIANTAAITATTFGFACRNINLSSD
jgi:hypothetical protein